MTIKKKQETMIYQSQSPAFLLFYSSLTKS